MRRRVWATVWCLVSLNLAALPALAAYLPAVPTIPYPAKPADNMAVERSQLRALMIQRRQLVAAITKPNAPRGQAISLAMLATAEAILAGDVTALDGAISESARLPPSATTPVLSPTTVLTPAAPGELWPPDARPLDPGGAAWEPPAATAPSSPPVNRPPATSTLAQSLEALTSWAGLLPIAPRSNHPPASATPTVQSAVGSVSQSATAGHALVPFVVTDRPVVTYTAQIGYGGFEAPAHGALVMDDGSGANPISAINQVVAAAQLTPFAVATTTVTATADITPPAAQATATSLPPPDVSALRSRRQVVLSMLATVRAIEAWLKQHPPSGAITPNDAIVSPEMLGQSLDHWTATIPLSRCAVSLATPVPSTETPTPEPTVVDPLLLRAELLRSVEGATGGSAAGNLTSGPSPRSRLELNDRPDYDIPSISVGSTLMVTGSANGDPAADVSISATTGYDGSAPSAFSSVAGSSSDPASASEIYVPLQISPIVSAAATITPSTVATVTSTTYAASVGASATAPESGSPTSTGPATSTVSGTQTPTNSATSAVSGGQTFTPSATAAVTEGPTLTATATPTVSEGPTLGASATPTVTVGPTQTVTTTPMVTEGPTLTASATPTITVEVTPTGATPTVFGRPADGTIGQFAPNMQANSRSESCPGGYPSSATSGSATASSAVTSTDGATSNVVQTAGGAATVTLTVSPEGAATTPPSLQNAVSATADATSAVTSATPSTSTGAAIGPPDPTPNDTLIPLTSPATGTAPPATAAITPATTASATSSSVSVPSVAPGTTITATATATVIATDTTVTATTTATVSATDITVTATPTLSLAATGTTTPLAGDGTSVSTLASTATADLSSTAPLSASAPPTVTFDLAVDGGTPVLTITNGLTATSGLSDTAAVPGATGVAASTSMSATAGVTATSAGAYSSSPSTSGPAEATAPFTLVLTLPASATNALAPVGFLAARGALESVLRQGETLFSLLQVSQQNALAHYRAQLNAVVSLNSYLEWRWLRHYNAYVSYLRAYPAYVRRVAAFNSYAHAVHVSALAQREWHQRSVAWTRYAQEMATYKAILAARQQVPNVPISGTSTLSGTAGQPNTALPPKPLMPIFPGPEPAPFTQQPPPWPGSPPIFVGAPGSEPTGYALPVPPEAIPRWDGATLPFDISSLGGDAPTIGAYGREETSQAALVADGAFDGGQSYADPLKGIITTYWGGHTIFQAFHPGIDIAAPMYTPIRAAAAGLVVWAGYAVPGQRHESYGLCVIIRHNDLISTLYAHMDDLTYGLQVRAGDTVQQGETIGYIGMTGWTTGPHLHFEMRERNVQFNPLLLIPDPES